MAISLQQFRDKVQAGGPDAERLEVNRDRTGLHRKGISAGGRAVEWIRDAVGMRKAENRQVMHTFVAALRAEHGDLIGDKAQNVLQGHESKPLSSRQVRQIISDADTLRNEMRRQNQQTARLFAPRTEEENATAVGYMSAVLEAHKATGASDAQVAELFKYGAGKSTLMRSAIRQAIEEAGQDGKKAVTNDEARAIAQTQIEKFLRTRMANEATLDGLLERGGAELQARELAEELGVPTRELVDAVRDPTSPTAQALKQRVANAPELPWDRPTDDDQLLGQLQGRAQTVLIQQLVPDGFLPSMERLPADVDRAKKVGEQIATDALRKPAVSEKTAAAVALADFLETHDEVPEEDKLAARSAADALRPRAMPEETAAAGAALLNREIEHRLASGSPEDQELAKTLNQALLKGIKRIPDPDIQIAVLTRTRNGWLADAQRPEATQAERTQALQQAAVRQNDIIAIELAKLDAPQTAQTSTAMTALAEGSPALAAAMDDMDRIEREYVAAQGGNPDRALGWRDMRNRLAEMRNTARDLDEPRGNELQAFIADRMRGLVSDMIGKAVDVLGPPPQPFAAISLGSASRGEASPYSDVEFGILLDGPEQPETADYMRRLSELVKFQVTSLGENGTEEDNVAPKGFHWDEAANTPLEAPDKFVGTADSLISANLGEGQRGGASEPADSIGLTMFANAELLYGSENEQHSWNLVKDFQQKVDRDFKQPSEVTPGQTKGQGLGRWMMAQGAEVADLRRALSQDVVDVKAVSRLPMMLVQGLALAHDIRTEATGAAANSTLARLDALVDAKVLSREDADVLANAFMKLGEVRIQAHLEAGQGEDKVYFDPAKARAAGGFAAPELRQVMQDLLPFVEAIDRHLADPSQPLRVVRE